MKVKLTLTEEMLGTCAASPEVHAKYIASLAPDAKSTEEEVEALGVDEVVSAGMTVFPRENGQPFIWDYMIRGFFKAACGALGRIKGTEENDEETEEKKGKKKVKKGTLSSKIKAYKKIIDTLVFVKPRKIMLHLAEGAKIGTRPTGCGVCGTDKVVLTVADTMGDCQRPLRCETAKGPRIALANSETVPAGSWIEFEVITLDPSHEPLVHEWLDFGKYHGLGQWRNSGKGTFTYEVLD